MKIVSPVLLAFAIAFAVPLAAQAQTASAAADSQAMTSGVVKKVDAEQGKITISHEPLTNLGMPAMTMVFRVADPKALKSVKASDNIKFVAEKVNGAFTVTALEKAS